MTIEPRILTGGRSVRFALAPLVALLIGAGASLLSGSASPASAAIGAICPTPTSQVSQGIDICVDRGDNATYQAGDRITVCVSANIPQIMIYPPPPPPTNPTYETEFTSSKGTVLGVGSKGAKVRLAQAQVGTSVDGDYGRQTAAAVAAYRRAHGLPAGTTVDRAVWNQFEAQAHPLLAHWGTVVRRGSRGAAVTALQRSLGVPADGVFGTQTEAAVRAVQRWAGLSANGFVGVLTWRAVERRAVAR